MKAISELTYKKMESKNNISLQEQSKKIAPVKVVRFLQKELRWQLDYTRGGVFENNQTSGLFYFICLYHDPAKFFLELWIYSMIYYPNKEKQFLCACGVEFKNVYEIWSKDKQVDLATAVKEVNYLIRHCDFKDNYEQLPQFKPSYGGSYKIKKQLIKKNVYELKS